jgi:hypothetical protein
VGEERPNDRQGERCGPRPPVRPASVRKKAKKKVLSLHGEGLSYRLIARNVGLSKNSIMEIPPAGG